MRSFGVRLAWLVGAALLTAACATANDPGPSALPGKVVAARGGLVGEPSRFDRDYIRASERGAHLTFRDLPVR